MKADRGRLLLHCACVRTTAAHSGFSAFSLVPVSCDRRNAGHHASILSALVDTNGKPSRREWTLGALGAHDRDIVHGFILPNGRAQSFNLVFRAGMRNDMANSNILQGVDYYPNSPEKKATPVLQAGRSFIAYSIRQMRSDAADSFQAELTSDVRCFWPTACKPLAFLPLVRLEINIHHASTCRDRLVNLCETPIGWRVDVWTAVAYLGGLLPGRHLFSFEDACSKMLYSYYRPVHRLDLARFLEQIYGHFKHILLDYTAVRFRARLS